MGDADTTEVNDGDPAGEDPTEKDAKGTDAKAKDAAEKKVDAERAAPVDVHPATRSEQAVYTGLRVLVLGVAKVWVRLRVVGREKLPAEGPFVLAPVHRSNLDSILAGLLRRKRLRYMAKASLWKVKPLGRLIEILGAFPVHRGTADRTALRSCMQVIENGESLVMFPEGTRKSGDTVDEVFDGPAYVAARAGLPLVPVGIAGSEAAMPVGAKFIRPRKIVMVVGDPIYPPEPEGKARVPRRVVRELTEQLKKAVQEQYDEARRHVS